MPSVFQVDRFWLHHAASSEGDLSRAKKCGFFCQYMSVTGCYRIIYIYHLVCFYNYVCIYIYIYHIPLKAWSVIGSIHELGGRGNWGPSPAQAADMLEDFGVVWGLSVYSAVREIYGE